MKEDPINKVLYKARYVAKGYSQLYGVDYFETFSPTARFESIRILMQIAAYNDLMVHQMDVKSAYLHAPIECELYIEQPEGYKTLNDSGEMLVWKLKKSLYGLKQSGRNWHSVIHEFFLENNFTQSTVDPCVYIRRIEDGIIIILVWVDDIVIAANLNNLMIEIKDALKGRFKMKELCAISFFLGIQFKQENGVITMSQSLYLTNILKKFDMALIKPRSTPCEINPSSYETETEDDEEPTSKYREMVGSLVYAMTSTRPDLSFVVTKLSQHLSCPKKSDWIMLKHVFRY